VGRSRNELAAAIDCPEADKGRGGGGGGSLNGLETVALFSFGEESNRDGSGGGTWRREDEILSDCWDDEDMSRSIKRPDERRTSKSEKTRAYILKI
jgi:hypothetical protein